MKQVRIQNPGKPSGVDKKKIIISVIIGSILVHVVVGIIATIWIVAQYFTPPPAAFEVQRDIRLPAQERQHAMNMAQYDAMTPKPSFNEKIASMRPTDFALPDLPQVPMDQMLPLDPSALISDSVDSLVGTAGFGAGGLGLGGTGGTGDAISFFGVQSDARRVLLMYDVSTTVLNKSRAAGVDMGQIRDRTKELINGLSINTRFGMVQFARNYAFFREELLPATDANREMASEWLSRWFTTDGSMPGSTPNMVTGSPGFLRLIEKAFELEPDVIFVISDGGFWEGSSAAGNQRRIPATDIERKIRELQERVGGRQIQVNFIGFEVADEDRRVWRRITGRSGGQFREMD